jgi:hypothetical protein
MNYQKETNLSTVAWEEYKKHYTIYKKEVYSFIAGYNSCENEILNYTLAYFSKTDGELIHTMAPLDKMEEIIKDLKLCKGDFLLIRGTVSCEGMYWGT